MAKVYFTDLSSEKKEDNLYSRIKKLFEEAGEGFEFEEDELVSLKLHFGEKGIDTFLRPVRVAPIVEAVKEAGGKPFLGDSNTLYSGSRSNAVDHHRTAQENGWVRPVVDAPVIIADGLQGNEFYTVEIDGEHFDEVKIGAAFFQADSIMAVSHFKGHGMTGFGGALKNLGMGCASRAGKLMQHYDVKPEVNIEECIGCGECAIWCPEGAIEVEQYAEIDYDKCIGCGECRIVCPENAIKVEDSSSNKALQEKTAEYAFGALKDKMEKAVHFNFAMDVTPECDCPPWRKAPLIPDIGVLASQDPVALDQASFDMVKEEEGKDYKGGVDKFKAVHDVDPTHQLRHAEKIGFGEREYELIDISK
ncbi:MAG: DUF362 domain-containing protein [Candidatus Natronoplasma sp.]